MHARRFFRLTSLLLDCARPVAAEVLVVLNSNDDNVSLIDTPAYREIARVPIGKGPHGLMATSDERFLIVGIWSI